MRIKTVSVTYGRKCNLGEYNSATVECSMWADLDVEDDLDVAMHGLWDMAKENVKAQCLPLVNKGKAEVREFYLGVPVANPQAEVEKEEFSA